jgi:hypothetical protein
MIVIARLLLIAGLASACVLMVGQRPALAQDDDAGTAIQAPSGDTGDPGDDSGQQAPTENPQ